MPTDKEFSELKSRVMRLEQAVFAKNNDLTTQTVSEKKSSKSVLAKVESLPKKGEIAVKQTPEISFIQVITVLGIIGIAFALIFLFFYAVAQQWIGQTGQILIGMFVGFGLFVAAYLMYEKNKVWSQIVYGGAIFIEYLSISVGVQTYKVFDPILGLIIMVLLAGIGLFVSLKVDSSVAAFLSLVAGFLAPILSATYTFIEFRLIFYLVLCASVAYACYKKSWMSVQVVTFVLSLIVSLWNIDNNPVMGIIYIIVHYLIFHILGVKMLQINKAEAVQLTLLILLPLYTFTQLFLQIITISPDFSQQLYGLILIAYAIVTLIEIMAIDAVALVKRSLLSIGVISIALGIIFMIAPNNSAFQYLLLFVFMQSILGFLSAKSIDNDFFKIGSYIAFAFMSLTMIVYLIVPQSNSLFIELIAFVLFAASSYSLYIQEKSMNISAMSVLATIIGFLSLWQLARVIEIATHNSKIATVALSVFWVLYIMVGYAMLPKQTVLIYVFLIITGIKIVFFDMSLLQDFYRIIGTFIVAILLLGGALLMPLLRKQFGNENTK